MPEEKMSEKSRPEVIIDHFKALKGARANFEGLWQTLHDYFYIEASDVSSMSSPGSELNSAYLYDATTLDASDVLASGFMNYLTPPNTKWGIARHKNKALSENKAVSDFYNDVTDEVHYALNRSNFYQSMFPTYKSSGVYGTGLLIEEEDYKEDVRFTSLPIKNVCVMEDARGRICEYYIEFEYTAFQAETRWGREKLSKEMQEELRADKRDDKKHEFILFIAERSRRNINKSDRENLPVEASWIDVKAKLLIDEGGYNEFPAMCHQFDKRPFIPWGYSPAMKCLPFARILNAIAKTDLRRAMKETDPPIALPNNSFISPMNMNPRAHNYYKKDALGSNPANSVFPIGAYGHPQTGMEKIEYYSRQVKTLMYNDVFLAFDNITKQMNNPEVMERINEKMAMLGPAVGRYTTQVLNPIFIRTIGILWRKGKLPEPPDEVINDPSFEIDFVGVLAQAQKRSELNALNTGLMTIAQMAQFMPDVLDKVDPDKVVDETWDITGAPVRVLRDDQEIADIRANRAQQQAQAQEMAMLQQGAMIGKDMGQADKHFADAKSAGSKK